MNIYSIEVFPHGTGNIFQVFLCTRNRGAWYKEFVASFATEPEAVTYINQHGERI